MTFVSDKHYMSLLYTVSSTFLSSFSEQCAAGSYHDSGNNKCVNCSRNFYQDQMGQTSCNKCSGDVRMYTLSEGSTAESDCVCKYIIPQAPE